MRRQQAMSQGISAAVHAIRSGDQKAAQVWDERIGSARVQARNWRLIAFGNLFLAAGLAGGMIWQAARGTITASTAVGSN
jgi:type IV secretory pathway TrbF-like protein